MILLVLWFIKNWSWICLGFLDIFLDDGETSTPEFLSTLEVSKTPTLSQWHHPKHLTVTCKG